MSNGEKAEPKPGGPGDQSLEPNLEEEETLEEEEPAQDDGES